MAEAALMRRVEAEPTPVSAAMARVRSVDIVRGLVCVLMAIDHVRVYSGIPAGGPTPGVFLTRWVTHVVAPAFCFFAGTAAYFLGKRLNDTGALRRFLISRGLLLVVLELTLIRFLWSFNPNLTQFPLAGVIWMLGWCMVLLGLFVGRKPKTIGWTGVGIVLLQQVFGLLPRAPGMAAIAPVWEFVYPTGAEAALGFNVLYVIVPWVGVMMAGYGFGLLWERDEHSRDRLFVRLGLGMTIAWVVIAMIKALATGGGGGEAGGDGPQPLWIQVLNQQKYPASQLFLLMTLGPAIALLPSAERWRGWAGNALDTFGRVPMWYYLMHLLVIHVSALIVMAIRTGAYQNAWYLTAPYAQVPREARWPLGVLYLVWAICIVVLYPLCRMYATRKRTRPARWMRYI